MLRSRLLLVGAILGFSCLASSAQAWVILICYKGQAFIQHVGSNNIQPAGGCAGGNWAEAIESWRTAGGTPEPDWKHDKHAVLAYNVLSNVHTLEWVKITVEQKAQFEAVHRWHPLSIRKEHLPPTTDPALWPFLRK